ncbi:sensor histidine kinase [Thiolapillus sp.]
MGVLLLGVLMVLLGIAAWIGRESAIQFALSRLHHDAEAILSSMDMQQRKIVRSLPPIYTQPLSGHYYMIVFPDGQKLLSRSLWDQELVLEEGAPATTSYWLVPGPQGQQLLVWQRPYEKDGQRFSIAIAEDVAPLLQAVRRFFWIGLIASLAAVLFMLVVQRIVIRRAFARLDVVQQDLRAVRRGLRSQVGEDVPAEVLPMVTEFNKLLDAWKQHQERSRNAVGNLAHALKAPLSLISRQGEKTGDQSLQQQAQTMQQLVERELKRARITGRAVVGKHFRPKEDLVDIVDTVQALHHQKPLEIDLEVNAPESLAVDQNDMLEMAGNLLDNAAKWAGRRIRVCLVVDDGLSFVVEDDGPGIAPDRRAALLARGQKLDENQPGHGLGLAIVNDIARQYGGELCLDRSTELGGLKVRVTLPLV